MSAAIRSVLGDAKLLVSEKRFLSLGTDKDCPKPVAQVVFIVDMVFAYVQASFLMYEHATGHSRDRSSRLSEQISQDN